MEETNHEIPDIILRASACNQCNFLCTHCPKGDWKSGGMENYTPDKYAGDLLSVDDYVFALRKIRNEFGIRTISFTGGEPTINVSLSKYIHAAREIFERVEITTNASNLSPEMINVLRDESVDLVKISLDTVNEESFNSIVNVKHPGILNRVIANIKRLAQSRVPIAMNAVVMMRNLAGLGQLIDFANEIKCPLHLLDYVFYPSKRQDWQSQFVPMEYLARMLSDEYGPPRTTVRYGCTFYQFDFGDIYIRFKDSMTATMRAQACGRCSEYCQEGPYGLKLSVEGWVTACPSVDPDKGVLLTNPTEAAPQSRQLVGLVPMFLDAYRDESSFQKLTSFWSLQPEVSRDDVRKTFELNKALRGAG